MKNIAVHQITAGFTMNDAISNEALCFRSFLRAHGYSSDIYSEPERILPGLRKDCLNIHDLAATVKPDDIVILHLSIGSVGNDIFAGLACKKILLYHNITPSGFFHGFNEQTAHSLAWGRKQLKELASVRCIPVAVSRFNALEMEKNGYRDVRVLPLLIDFGKMDIKPDPAFAAELNDGKTNIIFVGRCAPNKRVEHILNAFCCYQRACRPESRLVIAGSWAGMERYQAVLSAMIHDMGLKNAVFTGNIPQNQLNAVFKAAHVFLCMSEHEGFCVPIIESMAHDVPVLAYEAGAVPETMGNAGILFRRKEFPLIAEMMHTVVENHEFRAAVLTGQRERIIRFKQNKLEPQIIALIQELQETSD